MEKVWVRNEKKKRNKLSSRDNHKKGKGGEQERRYK